MKTRPVIAFMPFASEFDDVWDGAIERAVKSQGLECLRVDRIKQCTNILEDITKSLERCVCAIIDVTGNNANVMFELGLTLAKGKPRIIICQSSDDLCSDIRHIRVIVYENTWHGIEKLRDEIENFLRQSVGQNTETEAA